MKISTFKKLVKTVLKESMTDENISNVQNPSSSQLEIDIHRETGLLSITKYGGQTNLEQYIELCIEDVKEIVEFASKNKGNIANRRDFGESVKESMVGENEFDGKKNPVHNAKVSDTDKNQAETISAAIWGVDNIKEVNFHSKHLQGALHFHIIFNDGGKRFLCKYRGEWFYGVGQGENSTWKKFDGEALKEESSTSSVAGYQTPNAFTKNKKGSPKGIAAASKYGTVVEE